MQMHNPFATLVVGVVSLAAVQVFAEERVSFAERFLYGGEVTLNASPEDLGYFNETEYERNGLRLLRLNFALEFRASENVTLLTEIRSDNFDAPEPYALYVRVRPWRERPFDIQAGRIPPVFGAFARRRYDIDNPLIGYPLAYQYPTTVRYDSAPEEVDQMLRQRGFGVKVRYPIGDALPMAGVPLVNPLKWDTGLQVKLGRDPLELAVAVTQGTISNPRVRDDNSGKQLAGRVGWRPAFGWVLGLSAARGEYVSDEVSSLAFGDGARPSADQTAWGIDTEYSTGHFLLRAEAIWSRWDMPTLETGALGALGWMVESTYKLTPGFYIAARVDHMSHDRIDGPAGTISWDSAISRIEVGAGYYIHRHLLAKATYQYNERDAGPLTANGIPAVQLLFWF